MTILYYSLINSFFILMGLMMPLEAHSQPVVQLHPSVKIVCPANRAIKATKD